MARLRPDFWRTLRPGAADVPAADADMLRTDNASITTVPWLLAMAVLCLWRKSLRADAPCAYSGLNARACGAKIPVTGASYAKGGSAWLMTRFTVGKARRSARSIASTFW